MKQKVEECIMEYAQEEYTRHYIITALFKLMSDYDYGEISVTDIAKKAGVGRATFYRYLKKKEDIIIYYFERTLREYQNNQHYYPRCKEDYIQIVYNIMVTFKEHKKPLKLIRKARLECMYLEYLNKNFVDLFDSSYPNLNVYTPYLYAGMLFNISMRWLDNNCDEDEKKLAEIIVNAIYK